MTVCCFLEEHNVACKWCQKPHFIKLLPLFYSVLTSKIAVLDRTQKRKELFQIKPLSTWAELTVYVVQGSKEILRYSKSLQIICREQNVIWSVVEDS